MYLSAVVMCVCVTHSSVLTEKPDGDHEELSVETHTASLHHFVDLALDVQLRVLRFHTF